MGLQCCSERLVETVVLSTMRMHGQGQRWTSQSAADMHASSGYESAREHTSSGRGCRSPATLCVQQLVGGWQQRFHRLQA